MEEICSKLVKNEINSLTHLQEIVFSFFLRFEQSEAITYPRFNFHRVDCEIWRTPKQN